MNFGLSSGFLCLSLALFAGHSGLAQNRYVNPDGLCGGNVPCYATIQAAVTAASPGDVILVAPGVYTENVVINTPVTLRGAQAGVPGNAHVGAESVVDGTFTGAPFGVYANNVTIDGFKVINGQNGLNAGISVSASVATTRILNNVISGNSIGVYANSNGPSLVQYNLFDANNLPGSSGGTAIYSENTVGLQVLDNEIKNHTENNPVLFAAAAPNAHSQLVFSANNLHDNSYGFFALALSDATISNNTFSASAGTSFTLGGGGNNVSIQNNFVRGSVRGIRVTDAGYGAGINSNVTVNDNDLSAPFADEAILVPAGGHTGTLNATCNWFGTLMAADIALKVSGDVNYVPYLVTGTDNNLSSPGFQPVPNSCLNVDCSTKGLQKVLVCHSGKSLCIALTALPAHLEHGDVLGDCPVTTNRELSGSTTNARVSNFKHNSGAGSNLYSFFGTAAPVTPGNNQSCNAVQTTSSGSPADYDAVTYGGIDFPVANGLTLANLNNLATDYKATQGGIGGGSPRFVAQVDAPCGTLYVMYYVTTSPTLSEPADNLWHSTGNLASATSKVDVAGCGPYQYQVSYAGVQTAYGSSPVTALYLVTDAGWAYATPDGNGGYIDGTQTVLFDNSNINGSLYTYDDCDNDGVPDGYDCAPNDSKNNKWLICHDGQTICIAQNAVAAHLAHGDVYGSCVTPTTRIPGQSEKIAVPEVFSLANYPNPFGKATRIQYSLPTDAKISIRLYDLTGKEVDLLFNGNKPAGNHALDYNSSKLSAGVYYCRMIATANGRQIVQTQKLVKAN